MASRRELCASSPANSRPITARGAALSRPDLRLLVAVVARGLELCREEHDLIGPAALWADDSATALTAAAGSTKADAAHILHTITKSTRETMAITFFLLGEIQKAINIQQCSNKCTAEEQQVLLVHDTR